MTIVSPAKAVNKPNRADSSVDRRESVDDQAKSIESLRFLLEAAPTESKQRGKHAADGHTTVAGSLGLQATIT